MMNLKAKLVTTTDSDKKIVYISLEETIKEQEKVDLLVKKNKKKGGEAFLLLETNIFRNITNSITYVYFGRK
ncbi:MAG: hypothetical protein ACLRQF_22625 [Thomasclavelia ramosa]